MHAVAEQQNIDVGQVFEEVVKCIYQGIISPGDHVIDVGAHVGFHTIPMARAVGRKGRVYAFEPLPQMMKILKKRRRRKFLFNIKLYKIALGNKEQYSSFQYFQQFPAYSGLQQRLTPFNQQEGKLQEISVRQSRLDSIFPADARFSLIKIDIEGGELHALMGGTGLLTHCRPVVIFECGFQSSADVYHYTMDDFFGFFEKLEYSVYYLSGEPFTRKEWVDNQPCWDMVALPIENNAFANQLPGYCRQVIDRQDISIG